ncbi:MAG: SRPBCC family protein [Polaribacter sp.]|uniref:SRPBCC family protein n=1 Tax=Polaribacter sp. TaxID=1920175 RepID=UPI002F35D228
MAKLHNKITINAPIEKIWKALSTLEELDKFDPETKKSSAIGGPEAGKGSKRRVDMLDGKNWFEETCTVSRTNEALTYELTACSFPVTKFKHSYSFKTIGNQIKVIQEMDYTMKFGFLGKILGSMLKSKLHRIN